MRRQIELHPDLSELNQLAAQAEDFAEGAGLDTALAFQLNLVLDELVTNAINYGFADRTEGYIHIDIERDGSGLSVSMRDNGAPFDPLQIPPPDRESSLEERPVGGLGLHFVRELMDHIEYRHEAGENRLSMRKAL